MKKFIFTLNAVIILSLHIFPNSKKPSAEEFNQQCFRCHSMATLGYKDESSGIIKSLAVLPHDFYNSNHKELECIDCHSRDFTTFPHPAKLKTENLYCLYCHKDEPKFQKYHFQSIESEFKQSVHYKKMGDKFTCFDCHDPHSFKINARVNRDVKETVLYDNHICLKCHDNTSTIKDLSGQLLPTLNVSHSWLPHIDLHWKSVRCIDCHTSPNAPGVSHLILPKDQAVKNCVECHSKNSILLQSLYKFQTKQERDREGFINAVILNNSYVIGATRNYYLNLLSFIIFGIVLVALSVHGILRWKSHKGNLDEK
ncbi:MAG: cytochrome c3 family protein [Bacteroidetes bacterium]|nr:cytochrome c3 family protein [Bacteroidota bacterium]